MDIERPKNVANLDKLNSNGTKKLADAVKNYSIKGLTKYKIRKSKYEVKNE
jgi:hypothetical protein